MDTALSVEAEQLNGMDALRAQKPDAVLYMIKKSDLTPGGSAVVKKVIIPMEGLHFNAAYDDDETISLFIPHMNSADASEWIRDTDTVFTTQKPVDPNYVGLFTYPTDRSVMGHYEIDPESGAIVSEKDVKPRTSENKTVTETN